MKIKNHRLVNDDGTPVRFVKTPNVGGPVDPRYLVMHYTAGRDAAESIAWMANPAAKASAHVVIARDGAVTQMVPFDRVAWHAGKSRWEGLNGLNAFSLGIELDNAGILTRSGDGKWKAWFGGSFKDADVTQAVHKDEAAAGTVRGWHEYTDAQLEAAAEVATALVAHYGIGSVIGHDDIAPGRKQDPGPLFPMGSFRGRVLGRADDRPDVFVTTDTLNIRAGAGAGHALIQGGPLPRGTRVEVLEESGSWRRVEVLDTVGGAMDLEGWVHGRFLVPDKPAAKVKVGAIQGAEPAGV